MEPYVQFPILREYAPVHEGDIRFAFERGWFSPKDCVRIFLEWPSDEYPLSKAAVDISLLLPDDLERLSQLMEAVTARETVDSRRYVRGALMWVADTRDDGDPQAVEDVYELFDYDIGLLPLVTFQGIDAPRPREALREFVLRERAWARTRLG